MYANHNMLALVDENDHAVRTACFANDEEAKAKLLLIAAAPDMYRALMAFVRGDSTAELVAALDMARDALDLADGLCMPSTIKGE